MQMASFRVPINVGVEEKLANESRHSETEVAAVVIVYSKVCTHRVETWPHVTFTFARRSLSASAT